MNCLLFYTEEILSNGNALVKEDRKKYILTRHIPKLNTWMRAGVIGGKLGKAKLVKDEGSSLEFQVSLNEEPPKKHQFYLIQALPRPQAQKRIIKAACEFGIVELCFIRTERVVKSYFSSKSLESTAIKETILDGLEQAVDTIPPEIKIFDKFHGFLDYLDSQNINLSHKLLFDSRGIQMKFDYFNPALFFQIAIGPEAGFNEYELESFKTREFQVVSLGDRMLSCDKAAMAALTLGSINYV